MTITSLLRSAPMIRLRRLALLLTLAAFLATTMAATPAEAAKRKVPFGFFGTVLQQRSDRPRAGRDARRADGADGDLRGGVGAIGDHVGRRQPAEGRLQLGRTWTGSWPRPRAIDLDVLPNVLHTPRWASSKPRNGNLPAATRPRSRALYAELHERADQALRAQGVASGGPTRASRSSRSAAGSSGTSRWPTSSGPRALAAELREAARRPPTRRSTRRIAARRWSLAQPGRRQWRHAVGAAAPALQGRRQGLLRRVSVHPFTRHRSVAADDRAACSRSSSTCAQEMKRDHDRAQEDLPDRADLARRPRQDPEEATCSGFETTPKGQAARLRAGYNTLAKQRQLLWHGRATGSTGRPNTSRSSPGGPDRSRSGTLVSTRWTAGTSRRCRS